MWWTTGPSVVAVLVLLLEHRNQCRPGPSFRLELEQNSDRNDMFSELLRLSGLRRGLSISRPKIKSCLEHTPFKIGVNFGIL